MLSQMEIQKLDDFFIDLSKRAKKGVFFYRINGFNEQIKEFLFQYYQVARTTGTVIEGKIPNPDEKNLSYYEEIMGMKFALDVQFIEESLKKWLPRMQTYQRSSVSKAMFDTLDSLRMCGKTENMLKNAYIKFMCWLYYKFERVVNQLGTEKVPKILYEGSISNYELLLIRVLSKAGCDVVLLQYEGDANYLKLDSHSEFSKELKLPNMVAFPKEFNLNYIRNEIKNALNQERLYGVKPAIINCTNAWIQGKGLEDINTSLQLRGNDKRFFYNAFIRMNGVEDKITYLNELYQFYLELKNKQRRVVIVDNCIETPTTEEIAKIKRNNYTKAEQLIFDLQTNIRYPSNVELQRVMLKSFVDILLEESKLQGMTVNKLCNKAVYLLCWLKRYQESLFSNWKFPEVACFIYFGGCKNSNEALFMKFLSKLPVDIVILAPNLEGKCVLEDKLLYEITYKNSLQINQFPRENTGIQIGTTAYHAERELDTLMYQNSGMYRSQQYGKATAITLQTMYEEISLLWSQEVKYRQNFSTNTDTVNIPVIYSKVCGVKNGDLKNYWIGIKQLLSEDTVLITKPPYIHSAHTNPIKAVATEFYKNGKLQRQKIKNHAQYKYGILREEMQEHILDKLQILIDQKIIKGTLETGVEYAIIATVLNIKKDLLRLIQKFDFTKTNPKIVYINTTEKNISLEDTILMAFLNLLGFDIVYFIPTGYQTIEKYYNKLMIDEHQIGEYMYDLEVPDFNAISLATRSWKDKFFRRGT